MKQNLQNKEAYYYDLPQELIAQYPLSRRSSSRLLCLNRKSGTCSHQVFHDIINLLQSGDLLVLNKTRVIPARLFGKKKTGAKVEILLLNQIDQDIWECLVKPGKRLKPPADILISDDLSARIIDYASEGARKIKFNYEGDFFDILEKIGNIPLPPYITRQPEEKDKETYQTVYAVNPGSVAAPTAGLHFTDELISQLKEKGIQLAEVDLNVGLGTFRPVKTPEISQHQMHREFCSITPENAQLINQAKKENRRVIAVGTTSTRTLESFAENGRVKSGSHFTDIFIYPGGKELQIIDGLLTNFHLPESTLIMLVCAFAGYENTMKAYKLAVQNRYRFFSYGDAMLIL